MPRIVDDVWSLTNLQADKVGEALDSLGVDRDAFSQAYVETRKTRGSKPITPEEREALNEYKKHKNIAKLAERLEKSVPGASMLVARAFSQGAM
jgi:hypothetical protein